ncbi:MAG: ester cyclase [Nitrososphaeraceae archaeon]
MFRNALPDLYFSIEDMIAEGDKVVTLYTSYGTHLGELMGMPPTKKKLTASGIVIDRIDSSSKIVEHWAKRDDLGLLQQLGVIPQQGK